MLGFRLALFGPFLALGDMSVAGRSSGSGMNTQQSETTVKLGHNSASRQEAPSPSPDDKLNEIERSPALDAQARVRKGLQFLKGKRSKMTMKN